MPPEPLPWDRKEFGFKDRKHERGPGCDALGGGGGSSSSSITRWRDPYHGPRDFHRASPRRPPQGHYRQGGGYYQVFPEESGSGHGGTPSRSGDRFWLEDESFRPSSARYGSGRTSGSSNRESRGSFRRSPYWDYGDFSQQPHEPPPVTAQRSVAVPVSMISHVSSQLPLKDQPDKSGGGGVDDGSGTGQRYDRDHSLGSISWKPLKWTRPCSLSSKAIRSESDEAGLEVLVPPAGKETPIRSPVTSPPQLPLKDQHDKSDGGVDDGTGQRYDRDHSLGSISWKPLKWTRPCNLSSKAIRSESDEAGLDVSVPAGKETPIRSPVTSPLPSEDGAPKKKQRLGWGQGLAKYEKKKVEGSADVALQGGLVQCPNSAKAVPDGSSPKLIGIAGCTSPATLCSTISSSSPARLEDKPCIKEAINDTNHPSDSSGCGLQNCLEEFSIKLDPLEVNTNSMLTSLLADLLQPEDACSGDSCFTRHTGINKLLVLKGDISKNLEKTECEIDLLENELKSLNVDGKNDRCQSSFTLQAGSASDSCGELADVASKVSLDSTPSKDHVLVSSVTLIGESLRTDFLEEHDAEVEDVNDDSPETLASKCAKSASSVKGISDSDAPKLTGYPLGGGERPATMSGHEDGNYLDAGSTSVFSDPNMSSNGKMDNNLLALIMTSNRDAAKEASQVFDKALATDPPRFDIWGPDNIFWTNNVHIREKLAKRKRLLTFKDRVLALKYRAFHHLWKEDLRLLSIRKHRPKTQKRNESSSRSSQSGSQRHRSSIRTRFILPAGNLTLVPTSEIVDFTSKLLSDSQIKLYRNNVNMPALILDETERRYSSFLTSNGLIEDPPTFEKERAMINPWTQEEKEVFMEMLATFGKDFTKISSFLNHKTTADCIEFYYKNHKSESFKDVKKRLDLRKQWQCLPTNTYLVTSGKKWNHEVNAASLDMLGAASVVAAHCSGNTRNHQKYAGSSVFGSYRDLKVSRGGRVSLERASSAEISRHERETAAADVLAGICGALSSEAMSSCVTSSIDPAEKMSYVTTDRPLTPEVTQNIDEEDTCSDEGCGELDSVDWSDEEKSVFIRALSMYGKDFARISHFVGTRSREQCKIFFSKARKCLGLDVIQPGSGMGGTPMSDTNGGRSDTDDAGAPEMDSAICSTQSCSKLDADFTQSMANTSSEGFIPAGNTPIHSEVDRSSEQYEVGGSNQEEVEGKVERPTTVLNEEKLVGEGDNSQSDKLLKEVDDAALRCNEPIQFHEVAEFVDGKIEEGGIDLVTTPIKPFIRASLEGEQLKSHATAEVQQEHTVGSFCVDGLKGEVDSQEFMVPESRSVNEQQIKVETDADNVVSLCSAPNFNANENDSDPGTKVSVSHSLTFAPNHQHQIPLELLPCLQKHPQAIPLKQESSISLPSNKVLPDPSICFKDLQHAASQSVLNLEGHGNKRHQNSVSRDFYQQYLMGNLSLSQVKQPLHILRGYPLQVVNHKEIKREADLISENPALPENISKGNGISQLNLHKEKFNGSRVSNSRSGIHLERSENQPEVQLRPCSQSSCGDTEEQSHRTGDVKLFGQILSHPSSMQKSNSSSECDSQPLSPMQNRSATMKSSSSQKDGTIFVSMPGSSYGFWDGNRIQTGYSSLPESAIMLAKYQGSLAGASFYSTKESVPSSNGVMSDYQQAYMQALAADGKSFPELQKRNGFETVSGFQQQGRAMLGVNVVGGGGILVGGGGVSDPVAALKMHYGRAKILTNDVESWNEVESWRGDVGGR